MEKSAAHPAPTPAPKWPKDLKAGRSVSQAIKPGQGILTEWPQGKSPLEVGRRITANFLGRQIMAKKANGHIIYPEACAWYGALTWARFAGNEELRGALLHRFEQVMAPSSPKVISPKAHVDDRAFGIVPLEIYIQNKDTRAYFVGTSLADLQWLEPDAEGMTREARYWIDDMYMIPALQVQAWRATGEARFLDRAALTAELYLKRLQQPNGLFLHAEDSPFYWGRGNGWFAAGLAELLSELPVDHPRRAAVLQGYNKMMQGLLASQDVETGLWRQLIDQPDSWIETSGSAMFTFAFVMGVRNGWLEANVYGPPARKAWLALVDRLDSDANLTEICVGTNKGNKEVGPDLAAQKAFYLARPRKAGDCHGQAPMLWTATALLR